jgi:hypothetical protein
MSKNSFKISKSLVLKPTSAPSNPQNGEIYYDETTDKFYGYENGEWHALNGQTSMDLSSETSARVSSDESLATAISAEESVRISSDSSLASAISAEESTRISADSSLTTRISTEESSRIFSDSSVSILISSETSARVSADSSLDTKISTETSARASADASLTLDLSTETSARVSADSSLTTRISTEESVRLAADSSLESEINQKVDKTVLVDMKEPTGHADRTQSIISFDESTRTFSIAPAITSFDIYTSGVKQTITTTLTKQIPDISGNYFLYINTSGALDYYTTFNPALLTGVAYTAFIHWNSTDNQAVAFGEERHGITMDGTTHSYLHTTRGTQISSGASITFDIAGDGTADSDTQIALTDMQIRDEDITVNITNSASPSAPFQQILSPIANIPVVYRVGSEWKRATATEFPMSQGTVRAQYNKNTAGVWSLEDASADGKYLVSYIFATTNVEEPVIALLGQAEFSDLDDAKANGTWDKISFGDLPAQEMKLLYLLFYETSSAYTNTPKAAMKSVLDIRWGADRQVSASVFNGDHANLSGLGNDDHTQYLLIDGTRPMGGHLNMNSNNITNVNTINGYSIADISASVSTEVSSRISADSSLDSKISSETSARISADSSLATAVSAEASSRIAEDLTFLKLDGTRSMSGSLNLNNFNITSINKSVKKILVTTPTFTTVTNSGTLNLSNSSSSVHFLTGTAANFSVVFPDSTTLDIGTNYEIYNRTPSPITLKYFDGTTIGILSSESVSSLILQDNSTQKGMYSPFSVEVAQAAGISNYNASATTAFATTATNTYQQITDFVVTPAAGKYAVFFNCSATSTNNNSLNYVALYKDGTIITNTERVVQSVASNFTLGLNTLGTIDFNGTEQLRVYVKVTTGVLTVNARTGVAIRLGPVE